MKKLILIFFLIPFLNYSQTDYSDYLNEYQDSLRVELTKYENGTKTIQDSLLNEEIDEILKSVIFGSSDFTTNASSFSFQQGEDETSITASINHPLSKTSGKYQVFLKSGIFAKGKENIFNLYSEDSWQNEIGGNLGLILKFSGSKYYDNGTKLKLLNKRREYYSDSLLYSKRPDLQSRYTQLNTDKILLDTINGWRKSNLSYATIRTKVSTEDKKLISRIEKKGLLSVRDSITTELMKLKFVESHQKLQKAKSDKNLLETIDVWLGKNLTLEDIINTKISNKEDSLFVRSLMKKYKEEKNNSKKIIKKEIAKRKEKLEKSSKKLQNYIESELYQFDKKNNPTYGYSLSWFDLNIGISNATYHLSNDSIIKTEKLQALDLEEFDSRKKIILSSNFNFIRETNKSLGYLQFGAKLTIGNFLDSNLFNGPPIFSEVNNEYFIIDDDGNLLGNYSNLDQTYSFFSPHIYFSLFLSKKKNIGFDLNYEYNLPGKTPDNLEYTKNKTVKLGLLFRNLGENKISKATFGLETGFENVPADNYNDYFFTRLKIGVPFNIFTKTK